MQTLGRYVPQTHVNLVIVIGREEVGTDSKHVEYKQEYTGNDPHPILAEPPPDELSVTQLSYFDCGFYFFYSLDCLSGSALYFIHSESSDLPKRGLCLRSGCR